MSDPRRLRDLQDGVGRRLLDAASEDRPSDEARKKAALALGIAAPIVPPSPASSAGSGVAPASSAAVPSTIAQVVGTKIGAALWVPLAIAAVAGGGGLWMIDRAAPAPVPMNEAARIEEAPTPEPAPIVEPAPIEAPSIEAPPFEAPPIEAPKRRPKFVITAVPLSREVDLLDAARAELKDGKTDGDALARYRAECPNGRLAPEAELIEIDRLLLAGDRDAAIRAAIAHRARHGDRLPPRHRALLEAPP
jgi:hypothetical protein